MVDEQPFGIALDSPLDVNAQNMLVPVEAPKFAFNRQKYQGSLLQSSVRYEADGWFAGWWGHRFDLVVDAEDYITPELGDPTQLSVIRRTDENNNRVYTIKQKDLGLTFTYNSEAWANWITGSGIISRTSDTTVDITAGTTLKGNSFTATINPYTGTLIAFNDISNAGLKGIAYKDGENIRFEATRDVAVNLTDYIGIRVNNVPIMAGIELTKYTYDNVTQLSTWNELFTVKIDSATVYNVASLSPAFTVSGTPTLTGYGTLSEQVIANIKDVTIDHLVYTFQYKAYWVQDLFASARSLSDTISQQINTPENSEFGNLLTRDSGSLRYNNACTYRLGLPIWLQHRLEFDYSVASYTWSVPVHIYNYTWIIVVRRATDDAAVYMAGFTNILNLPNVMSVYTFITRGASSISAAARVGTNIYNVTQPDNPRYSLFTFDLTAAATSLRNGNLYVPTTFQPYREDSNAAYDPRPVVWGGSAVQIYGLTNTGSRARQRTWVKNVDKLEQAKDKMTIAEMYAISDGHTEDIPFVPEYQHTSGTVGQDLLPNPFGYQPDPMQSNYDPRMYVHAVWYQPPTPPPPPPPEPPPPPPPPELIVDPEVKEWRNGQAATTNTGRDNRWTIDLTPDYTRYWIRTDQVCQGDWNVQVDIGRFWSLYWPTLPAPTFPDPVPERASPYAATPTSGVVETIITLDTNPDSMSYAWQPRSANFELAPPREIPYIGRLILGNFRKKSILHGMKDISSKTNWSWAFELTREIETTSLSPWPELWPDRRSSDWQYYNSNAVRVSASDPLVWKPITENFPGMTIYDRDNVVMERDKTTWQTYTVTRDSWILHFKCKNGETQFPIPTADFNNVDKDGSNYFSLILPCNGHFRTDQILLNLSTLVVWTIPSYTSALYDDNYKVLNRKSLARNDRYWQFVYASSMDPSIFSGDTARTVLNIPLCVPGYAVSRVTTPHILNSDITAFEVQNGIDTGLPSYMWRIDAREGAGYPYDLDLVRAELTSIQASSGTLYIDYYTTNKGPFYQLTKQPYTIDTSTDKISGFQDSVYPDWILRDLVPAGGASAGNYSENEFAKLYIPGTQAATVAASLNVLLKTVDFVETIIAEHKYDLTAFNGRLFTDVMQHYSVSKPAIGAQESHNQTITLATGSDTFVIVYNPDTTELVGSPAVNFTRWVYLGYTTAGETGVAAKQVSSVTININSPEVYTVVFKRTFLAGKAGLMLPVTGIVKQENHVITLDPIAYGSINVATAKLYDSTQVSFSQADVIEDNVIKIYVMVNNSAVVNFKPVGLITRNKNTIHYDISSTPNILVFEYDMTKYMLYFDTRLNILQYLSYRCTDIRTGKTQEVYRRELNDIVLFVKQFWSNTVEVENFWWIDADHVLELSSASVLLHKKIGLVNNKPSIHDWNGDNWEVAAESNRSILISTNDLYYNVSSAYNTSGILFKLQHVNNRLRLLYIDPLSMNWNNPAWVTLDIAVTTIPLLAGSSAKALPRDSIASYGPLNVDSLITTSKISSTTIGLQNGSRILLIGIKQNNGLGQWCLKINVTERALLGVVLGYGCVGPKGELTGGQIPIDYCDANGFNGIVQELTAALPETLTKPEVIPKLIVGTSSQQWFIQATMIGIVSHLTFDINSGTHTPVKLYLNNNVAILKHYAAYRGARLQDIVPRNINLVNLVGIETGFLLDAFLSIISPVFWYICMYYSVFAGVATALGSYAYTWRNSSDIKVKGTEDLTDQEKSFGKSEFTQSLIIDNKDTPVWAQVMMHLIKHVPESLAQVVVNKAQGQVAITDHVGRKFSQLFEDIVYSAISTNIDSSGFNVRAQSILKHQHSITSFYSISDKIECHAGPGFVNHNLKAQCTAQSMQDIQFDGKQLGFYSMLTALTKLTLTLKLKLAEAILQLAQREHENVSQQRTDSSLVPTISWGYFAALIISAGMTAAEAAIATQQAILDNLDNLTESFGGRSDAFINNRIDKHEPIAEGLHTYGNKSMSFFWPAFGIDTVNTYTNEGVLAKLEPVKIKLAMTGVTSLFTSLIDEPSSDDESLFIYPFENGIITRAEQATTARIPIIKCLGNIIPPDASNASQLLTPAPENMAVIEGTTSFLNQTAFKNEQIGVGPPVFGPPMIHDYMIDKSWALGYTAGAGEIISVSCDDTKLIDGPPSNVVITDDFCGVASSYTAIEIKKTYDEAYLRPTMVTANAIGLNINRINCVHDAKAYHAFDGQVNRIVNWVGGQGMDKELLYQQYLFQMNDHFKRSNIFPPAQFFGNFQGPPTIAIRSLEIVSNTIVEQTSGLGFGTTTPGENRNLPRFSTCVFSELLSSLPTTVRTLAPYKLRVNDGVTCLVTELRNTNTRYKAPTSVDFNIGTRLYRKTEEYVVELTEQSGAVLTVTRTPSAGLEFLGPTMTAAYFYSPATKLYYEYAGGTELQKKDILNRFNNVLEGRWDFINQEVIFNAQLGYTNENMILRLDGGIMGEVWPPNKTIYNDRSGFKIYSCAGGLVYQGPKRFIVSRFVTLEHMLPDIKRNKRKWKRLDREKFNYERDYGWEYKDLYTETPIDAVFGWTHNPFVLVTSMLGTTEDVDNKFEWSLTFAWSDTIDHLLEQNEYITVNVMAETVTEGGVVQQRPTHIYLSKEIFTRSNNAGYYTIKFQSNNGTGNRERLFIWSDGIVAIEDLKVACKQISASRAQPLITQVDLERLVEL